MEKRKVIQINEKRAEKEKKDVTVYRITYHREWHPERTLEVVGLPEIIQVILELAIEDPISITSIEENGQSLSEKHIQTMTRFALEFIENAVQQQRG